MKAAKAPDAARLAEEMLPGGKQARRLPHRLRPLQQLHLRRRKEAATTCASQWQLLAAATGASARLRCTSPVAGCEAVVGGAGRSNEGRCPRRQTKSGRACVRIKLKLGTAPVMHIHLWFSA